MKKFLMLITAVLLGFAVAGCQKVSKIPSGQGELEVIVPNAEEIEYGYKVSIYPYASKDDASYYEPIASETVYKSYKPDVFRLNVGNYMVNFNRAVQIKDGERITITI